MVPESDILPTTPNKEHVFSGKLNHTCLIFTPVILFNQS